MIVNLLMREESRRNDITIEDLDVDNQIRHLMQKNNIKDLDVLKHYLKTIEKMDYEYFYETQKNFLYMQALVSRIASIQEPTEDEIKAYYKDNKKEFRLSQENALYRVSVIFIQLVEGMTFIEQKNKKKLAFQLLEDLSKKQISFKDAAKKYSDDINTKDFGGQMEWVSLEEIIKDEANQKVFLKTKKGAYTEVLSTYEGFYIYHLDDVKASGIVPYEKPHRSIKGRLVAAKRKRIVDKKVDFLFKQSVIDKKTDRFQDLKLPHHRF